MTKLENGKRYHKSVIIAEAKFDDYKSYLKKYLKSILLQTVDLKYIYLK